MIPLLVRLITGLLICPSLVLASEGQQTTFIEKTIGFIIMWVIMDIIFCIITKK